MKWRGISEQAEQPLSGTLRERLLEIDVNARRYVRPENQQTVDDFVAWLVRADHPKHALQEGALAPEFTLPDHDGQPVDSRELLADGRLIVVFFRGRWCPYCVTTLEAWNTALPQLEATGAQLVAISP